MSRFDRGWVKVHRRVINEDIGWSGVQLAVWITLLCWATRFESKILWKGEQRVLPPGSVVIGIRELARRLNFSKDSVARALYALASRDSIRVETATRGTLITVCNWAEYQDGIESAATPARHERDTDETPAGRQPDLIGEVEKLRSKNTKSKLEYSSLFQEIYDRYPRQEGKAAGYKVFVKTILTEEDRSNLTLAIDNYVTKCRKEGRTVQYLKHFGTFMNCWQDYLVNPKSEQLNERLEAKPLSEVQPV